MNYTKGEWDCTCEAGYRGEVFHCPLHKAAPEMYAFLKELATAVDDGTERIGAGREMRLSDILAKAEGKK